MKVRMAPSSHYRLLIIAIVFALAYAWGPVFASAQSTECTLDEVCLEDPAQEEESDPPAEEEEEEGLLPEPEEVLDPITEPVEEVLDPITEPVEDELPDLPLPDETPDPIEKIEEITEPVEKEIEETKESAEKTIENVTQPVVETVEETADELAGPAPSEPKGPSGGGSEPPPGEESGRSSELLSRILAHELTAPAPLRTATASDARLAAASESSTPGLAERIGEIVTEVAKKLAFPLALALIVGGFLLVQNRLDRRDPKLADAPKDPHDELLSFE